jgi:hypothetical protein
MEIIRISHKSSNDFSVSSRHFVRVHTCCADFYAQCKFNMEISNVIAMSEVL